MTDQEPIEGKFVDAGETKLVAISEPYGTALAAPTFNREQLDVLKNTLATDLSDVEFELFVHVSRRTGLDPFARQIFAIKRAGKMTIQTSIDGFRLQAQRSGKLRGFRGPFWCGADGVWRDVWLEKSPPEAAKVEVVHADYAEPVAGVARWGAFVQTTANGSITQMWDRMGDHMLAKCAEALALRRAFPAELSGLYTDDEMGQADNTAPPQSEQRQERIEAPRTAQRAPAPPQARQTATPASGAPPARAPRPNAQATQAAEAAPKPAWSEEFKTQIEARGITLDDVTTFLGAPAGIANIQAWLDGEAGRTVAMLVEDAASLAKSEATPPADPANDDRPY